MPISKNLYVTRPGSSTTKSLQNGAIIAAFGGSGNLWGEGKFCFFPNVMYPLVEIYNIKRQCIYYSALTEYR